VIYTSSGDWDAAAALVREIELGRSPLGIFYAEAARGNSAEALAALPIAEQSDHPPFRLVQLAHSYALIGRPDEAMRVFAEIQEAAADRPMGESSWARAYIAVGDYEEALRRVELAVANRVPTDFAALTLLAANPWDDPELASPRFRVLLGGLWDDG